MSQALEVAIAVAEVEDRGDQSPSRTKIVSGVKKLPWVRMQRYAVRAPRAVHEEGAPNFDAIQSDEGDTSLAMGQVLPCDANA
jgi:hypothetical protein